MKHRLGRGAAIAAGAVAASLFVLLCMMFYGKEDYLSPERILSRGDALRFRIASLFVEPFGAGAYLAFGLAFLWSVVVYFREKAGAALPRVVGALACIPSFCALTSMAGGRHEFWSGSVGMWMGDLVYRGFGPVMGWTVLGTLFLVSFALATQLGFYTQFATLRGSLSFPLLPPEEAAPAEYATAVLEPGMAEPVESWRGGAAVDEAPAFPAEDFAPSPAPSPIEGPVDVPSDPDDFSDASLLNRDEHVADVRRRLAAGEPVTAAERKLVEDAREQAEMAFAIDALFEEPKTAVSFPPPPAAPAAPEAEPASGAASPATPALGMPDLPPFLLAPSAPPLLSQEIVVEGPALLPAASAPALSPPAPAPDAGRPARSKIETEEFAEAEGPIVVPSRSPYIFASVEFLPPNEELAEPGTPAPAFEPASEPDPVLPDPVEDSASVPTPAAEPAPAPVEGPAPSPVEGHASFEDEFFAYGFEEEGPTAVVEEPASAPDGATEGKPAPSPVEGTVEGGHAAASALVMASPIGEPAPASVPEGVFALPANAANPVEEPAPGPAEGAHGAAADVVFTPPAPSPVEGPAEDASWLLAAAKDLGLESVPAEEPPAEVPATEPEPPLAAPAPFLEPDPSLEVFPAENMPMTGQAHADAALAKLFGEPVPRTGTETVPPGPAQQEPREPPANLMPLLDKVEERVTLLSDPVLGDCLKDHGITLDLNDEVVEVTPSIVVDDDAPAKDEAGDEAAEAGIPVRGISSEEAAEAIVNSFHDLFGEPVAAEPIVAPEPPEPEVEALAAHGWGTLFPSMLPEGAEAAIEVPVTPDTGTRVPIHAPPPVDASVEGPVQAEPASVEPAPVVPDIAEEEEEAPKVDEALVSRLVEGLKAEDAPVPDGVPSAEPPAAIPAVVDPEEPAVPAKREGRDELYDQAIAAVRERGRGSVVVLQRKLGVGFTRATKILDQLVADGVLGPENASGSHPIL
jgi:hypothetical protein